MPSSTGKYVSCIYCGAEFIAVKPDDIHTKANKYKINRDDIETLHKCIECGKNNKLYWSEQIKRPN
ncbi:MAG: hypothetical protein ACM3XP_07830 [Nitrososphaerales archaeon]|jgi:DNA-directed RNA polymerase subunit RPC12/RpoP